MDLLTPVPSPQDRSVDDSSDGEQQKRKRDERKSNGEKHSSRHRVSVFSGARHSMCSWKVH